MQFPTFLALALAVLPSALAAPAQTDFRISPSVDTTKCLNVRGDLLANGTAVDMYALSCMNIFGLHLRVGIALTATLPPPRTGSSTPVLRAFSCREQTSVSTQAQVRWIHLCLYFLVADSSSSPSKRCRHEDLAMFRRPPCSAVVPYQ